MKCWPRLSRDTPSVWTSKRSPGRYKTHRLLDTLSRIGVDLIYGDTIAEAQPLDLLLNTSYFAIH
nr:PAS domain-containing protein [Salmonella sp. NCTC 7297]